VKEEVSLKLAHQIHEFNTALPLFLRHNWSSSFLHADRCLVAYCRFSAVLSKHKKINTTRSLNKASLSFWKFLYMAHNNLHDNIYRRVLSFKSYVNIYITFKTVATNMSTWRLEQTWLERPLTNRWTLNHYSHTPPYSAMYWQHMSRHHALRRSSPLPTPNQPSLLPASTR
jgi:hypothetical protein